MDVGSESWDYRFPFSGEGTYWINQDGSVGSCNKQLSIEDNTLIRVGDRFMPHPKVRDVDSVIFLGEIQELDPEEYCDVPVIIDEDGDFQEVDDWGSDRHVYHVEALDDAETIKYVDLQLQWWKRQVRHKGTRRRFRYEPVRKAESVFPKIKFEPRWPVDDFPYLFGWLIIPTRRGLTFITEPHGFGYAPYFQLRLANDEQDKMLDKARKLAKEKAGFRTSV